MKHYVFAYMNICEMETEREGGMRFTNSILEPQHYQTPKCFVFGCARTHTHTHIHFDTQTHMQQAVTQNTFGSPDGTYTSNGYYTLSEMAT